MAGAITVRPAARADLAFVVACIRELAEYERLAHECQAEPEALERHLFGEPRACECLVAELDGVPQGFALHFATYSTFRCRPGIWLEDLYVRPAARGHGLGRALLGRLAALARERGAARLEWNVLAWNEPALGFYRALGAAALEGWTVHRLSGAALAELAAEARG